MKPRRFTFDIFGGPSPQPGLLLVGPRARYVVTEARPVDSRIWHDRWAVTCHRVDDDTPIREPWSHFVPYRPGETPQDVEEAPCGRRHAHPGAVVALRALPPW